MSIECLKTIVFKEISLKFVHFNGSTLSF